MHLFTMNNLKAHIVKMNTIHKNIYKAILNKQLITCLCPANMKASLGSMLRLIVSSDWVWLYTR